MKSLVKVHLLTIAALMMFTSVAFGLGGKSVTPNQLPKGAYANGSDGMHVWVQTIYIKLGAAYTPTALADHLKITFPADVTIADINQDDLYNDEVTIIESRAVGSEITVKSASATEIMLQATAVLTVIGDEYWFTIPVETEAELSAGPWEYTLTFYGVATAEGVTHTIPVTIVDQVDILTWTAAFEDAGASGLVETNDRGKYYPDPDAGEGADFIVAATSLPNPLISGALAANIAISANILSWAATYGAVGNFDDGVDNDDLPYYLWVADQGDLSRVNSDQATRVFDHDPTPLDPKTYPASFDLLDFNQAAHTGFLSTYLLDEDDWWLYVTTEATGDWVIGVSDTFRVHHKPVFDDFYDATLGTGLVFDDQQVATDFDDIFVTGLAGDDGSLAAITLESGGVIGIAGAYSPTTNEPDISIFWFAEDVDDNAEVHMFRSTSATLTAADIDITVVDGKDVVTSLDDGNAVKIHIEDLFEEDNDAFYNFATFTSDTSYVPANTYYIYVVLNDSNNQTIKAVDTEKVATGVVDAVIANLIVKHYPFFGWHFYNPAVAGAVPPDWDVNVETAEDRYITLSWGNPPTGSTNKDGDTDLDAAGTATITIYAATKATGTYALITGGVGSQINDINLTNGVSGGTAWILSPITDNSDTKEANRYEWDFRNSGLAAGRYFIWAVMEHAGDKILAQFNPNGTAAPGGDADEVEFNLTHGSYMRAVSPYAGPPVELDNGDSYRLAWEAFDNNTTGSPEVFAVLAKVGVANPGNAPITTWITYVTDDFIWPLPFSTSGDNPTTGLEVGATATDGSFVFNVSDLATGAGAGAWSEGDYEVYYFYDAEEDDEDFDTGVVPTGVKAHGTIYLSNQTTSAYNIRLSPSKMSIAPGDTLEVDIYATDDNTAPNPNMAIFFVEIPQASLFEIVDKDGDPDNGVVQPFDNLIGTDPTVAPNELLGKVLMNSLETVGGNYVLGYLEKLASGATNDVTDSKMTSFKIVMSSAITSPIEDLEIVFSESEGFMTNLYNDDGSPQSTSLPPVALTVRMGQSGILYGAMDVEGREDQGEEVSFYLAEAGSFTPITDAAYLDANSDADGSDGVQLILGAAGYYELKGIPSGEYDILVRKDGYLDVIRPNERIVSMDYTAMNFTGGNKLYGGDAAGYDDDGIATTASLPDNKVDGDDTGAISLAFGSSPGDSLWNIYADIDESGAVGLNDLFMASKNVGTNGDGIFYREIPGGNEDAIIYLAVVDETAKGITFAVQAEKLFNLSAYSVDMFVPAGNWEIVSCSDGLASHFETVQASRIRGSVTLYGSAAKGYARVADKEVELMTITLRQLSIDPEMPTLSEVALISSDGTLTRALIGGMRDLVPDEFALNQNYPNPFNPSTIINFALPSEGQVRLTVFNLLGQEVRTLVSAALEPGNYKAVWNSLNNQGEKVGTGIYFYHLVVNNKVIATKKMVLMK